MTLTIPKTINRDNLNNAKRKLYIGYLYFKRYALWIFLTLFLLLVLSIIIKNVGRTNDQTATQFSNTSMIKELAIKVNKNVEPIVIETQSVSSSQLASLKQQLLIEKEKNKKMEKALNDQELQITSALDEINQNFQTFNNKSPESNKISVLTGASNNQTEYYNKVKAALSKINPRNNQGTEKLSTTGDENSQVNLTKKEG